MYQMLKLVYEIKPQYRNNANMDTDLTKSINRYRTLFRNLTKQIEMNLNADSNKKYKLNLIHTQERIISAKRYNCKKCSKLYVMEPIAVSHRQSSLT